ncbi:phage tail sheath family protein [Rhodohalobacter sulfatireducens]|uniref:Phage tail sheath subtilisin-like domain-containing protein n=1 Tax=Rhodohalobacter sulfatireducens TaxID=2911366 RepID=A0ABS9KGI5_9BACT|nr:phage tail sheath C-terminal domain-containing protein [Rhodohalobacter sulfatireducens]MCG2589947.1 phage tail sheath subtilisin-like domain-containing protein [Rhodohalobacter sulfatireducens]MDR9407925.1 phage tail sheath C-terminal domain-containing protein [Balneolaceae bacterium]
MSYKTPGVYIEEVSLLPPSVAQVETAIPAFIGYTEKGPTDPTKISSMLEYDNLFGGPRTQSFEVTLDDNAPFLPQSVAASGGESPYLMHPIMQMFFANGGGPCYIVSVGDYDDSTTTPSLDEVSDYTELEDGLKKIRKIDEVTLIVIPEAIRLGANEQYDLYKQVLMQCGDLKDRFGIFDLRSEDTDGSDFRTGIGTSFLSYGAAYYPHLKTSIRHATADSGITFSHTATDAFNGLSLENVKILADLLSLQDQFDSAKQAVNDAVSTATASGAVKDDKLRQIPIALRNTSKAIDLVSNALEMVEDESFSSTEFDSANGTYDSHKDTTFNTSNSNSELDTVLNELDSAVGDLETAMNNILTEINTNQTGIAASHNSNIETYFTSEFTSAMNNLLNQQRLTLPPSSTIAGIYAKVDEDRGVWKSPANVSVNNVSGPAVKITMDENDDFNVHSSGKSINVIRTFTGKGTLVWGARTLDGNSNEWRYVSVRRFFNMVEESVKKASEPFVFEPNDANTWVKVKAMIENFLTLQWRAGALMGAKPDEAFFVKVGLGETMTQDDVLNGRMIVEIGMAAVRPAEFIILRFSHKMLES